MYFDNTTIGCSTDNEGKFILKKSKDLKAPLIISFVGYEKTIIADLKNVFELKIYLKETKNTLNEVVLSTADNWSRELKLEQFRRHYLGDSENGRSSKILNEDDLVLSYNKHIKKLTARAESPIRIQNNNLEYLITVDLNKFEVNYSYVSKNKKRIGVDYVFYSGTNFFKSLSDNPSLKIIHKRKESYLGSTLHFMRSLANKSLTSEGYELYSGNNIIYPEDYIKIIRLDDLNKVAVTIKFGKRLNIVFQNKIKSVLEVNGSFYIDSYGNHSPIDKVRFGGDLGKQRMGDTLPLDFLIIDSKKIKS